MLEHVRCSTVKAESMAKALQRVLTNVGELRANKRITLMNAELAVISYGPLIWREADMTSA